MKPHGPWQILKTNELYQDRFIHVTKDDVIRPDGNNGTHVKVYMKAGVSVLPVDSEQNVFLTKEFHYAIGRVSIEVVSGGIDPGETADECAKRELQEELGIIADRWEDLGSVDPFTTIIESPTQLYLATGISFTNTSLEGTEQIERVKVSLSDAVAQVMDGTISHAPSCVVILKAARLLQKDRLGNF